MNEFKVDNMIDLDDDELVEVFNSIIILDTFYAEIDKQVAKPGAVLQIKEGTVKDSDEAVRFVPQGRLQGPGHGRIPAAGEPAGRTPDGLRHGRAQV